MLTHFMADPHLGHDGILNMSGRPFSSVEEMYDEILAQTNRCVQPEDRLFLLGDVSWQLGLLNGFLEHLNCKNVHLIWGNHDRRSFSRSVKSYADVDEVKIGGGQYTVFMSHYPHTYWPSSHYGHFHVYGHMHGDREATMDAAYPGRRAMDVGVDVAYRLFGQFRPFSEMDVIEILGNRPGHDKLEHYERLQNERLVALGRTPIYKYTTPEDYK